MSSSFGSNIKISIFGQSHSEAVGVTIDGLPAGKRIDFQKLEQFIKRRSPNSSIYSTARSEKDVPHFISGLNGNTTCGAPLTAVIQNTDIHRADYDNLRDIPRPSHADYTAYVKYKGYNDMSGGGHLSGRLTAPLCIAGGICRQLLEEQGIRINAHIKAISNQEDVSYSFGEEELYHTTLEGKHFPVLDDERGDSMIRIMEEAFSEGDSVGGVIECVISGLPVGIGNPMFDGLENVISQTVFAIPAVKGIEFGSGFKGTELRGSSNNDEFYISEEGSIATKTNNHGGILGGISSGMPVVFSVAVKPTPSIAKEQKSISLTGKMNEKLHIVGRHDACIVPRAVPCVEAAAAIAVYDLYLGAASLVQIDYAL